MATPVEDEKKGEEVKGGELLFCGSTSWDGMGRRKPSAEENLVSPTRLRPLMGVDIRFVASGCVSCHCIALDVEGRCYTWGRNEKGQLGHGDKVQRDRPTVISELSKYNIVRAGAGRSHSVVVTEDGLSFAFGWNKHGQLGSGSLKSEVESSPVRCLVSEVKNAVCGGDFTVWLTSVEGSSIMTAGLPQYGQLGHGTSNEVNGLVYCYMEWNSFQNRGQELERRMLPKYNTKDSSVKLAYEAQPRPRGIASLAREIIVKVACGTNHTVAVDKNGLVYTWGFGGYGRLGHREQKDEWTPRCVDVFTRHNILPPDAVVSAGAANSACTEGGGQLYMWGKIKNSGDDWMYPKPLMDLSGWNLRCMDSGNSHHFVGADSSCISWGHAQSGELGYGPIGPKSSANPKKVDTLEGMHVVSVACGFAHSLVVVDRTNVADRLEQLEVYDGKAADEVTEAPDSKIVMEEKKTKKIPAKKSQNSNKRKKVESSSEDEQNSEDYSEGDSDDSDELLNGQAKRGRGRGSAKNAAKSASGRKGRGRPPSGTKGLPSAQGTGLGKRGRPKKA